VTLRDIYDWWHKLLLYISLSLLKPVHIFFSKLKYDQLYKNQIQSVERWTHLTVGISVGMTKYIYNEVISKGIINKSTETTQEIDYQSIARNSINPMQLQLKWTQNATQYVQCKHSSGNPNEILIPQCKLLSHNNFIAPNSINLQNQKQQIRTTSKCLHRQSERLRVIERCTTKVGPAMGGLSAYRSEIEGWGTSEFRSQTSNNFAL